MAALFRLEIKVIFPFLWKTQGHGYFANVFAFSNFLS